MSLEYETRQQNSALTALKQRAAPPALTDQKPNVLYTMPVQTVERLEEVLQQTLALQKTIQASMAALATKESLEPLATAEQLHQWLEQTQALNQKTHRAMGEILSEMREEHKRDGRQRDEFTRELSEIRTTFQKDTQEAIASLRKWIPFIIASHYIDFIRYFPAHQCALCAQHHRYPTLSRQLRSVVHGRSASGGADRLPPTASALRHNQRHKGRIPDLGRSHAGH